MSDTVSGHAEPDNTESGSTGTTLPETMRTAWFDGAGSPDVIQVREAPVPTPAPAEVLLRVRAAGLNRADSAQRQGNYPPPAGASSVPGLEVSGTVVARGSDVPTSTFPDGSSVCALLAGGGYAEYVAVPVGHVMPVPAGLDTVSAAALPEVAATVVSNLGLTVPLHAGQWALVHGGSGGIGTFALQYLHALGVHTIATGSTAEKRDWARDHGADSVIDYTAEDVTARVADITDGHGADVILDVVGAAYLESNVTALADGGRLVVIGLGGGAKAQVNLGALLSKRAGIIATALRSRSDVEKSQIIAAVVERAWPLIEDGAIRVEVDRTFPLEDVRAAHTYFDGGTHRGKILLTM